MHIWGQDNSAPLLALHFGYAAGNIMGPVLAGPFLMETNSTHQNHSHSFAPSIHQNHSHSFAPSITADDSELSSHLLSYNPYSSYSDAAMAFDTVKHTGVMSGDLNAGLVGGAGNHTQSKIWISYAISGGAGILVALVLFILFLIGLPEEFKTVPNQGSEPNTSERKSLRRIVSPGACTGGRVGYGLQMFTLVFLFYVTNVGKDAAFLTFTLPIAIDRRLPLHFSKHSADLLMTVNSICSAAGRLLAAVVAKFLAIQAIVFIQMFFILIATVTLLLWGLEYAVVYWVATCVFNTFSSPLFPSVLAWADKYVQMTAVAVAVVDVATGIGALVFTWLAGYVFDYKTNGAAWILYLTLGCTVAMTLFMVAMQILGSCHGNRFESSENTEEDDEALLTP